VVDHHAHTLAPAERHSHPAAHGGPRLALEREIVECVGERHGNGDPNESHVALGGLCVGLSIVAHPRSLWWNLPAAHAAGQGRDYVNGTGRSVNALPEQCQPAMARGVV
jgi:hypothetical protein